MNIEGNSLEESENLSFAVKSSEDVFFNLIISIPSSVVMLEISSSSSENAESAPKLERDFKSFFVATEGEISTERKTSFETVIFISAFGVQERKKEIIVKKNNFIYLNCFIILTKNRYHRLKKL